MSDEHLDIIDTPDDLLAEVFPDREIVATLWRQLGWPYLSFVCYQLMLRSFCPQLPIPVSFPLHSSTSYSPPPL